MSAPVEAAMPRPIDDQRVLGRAIFGTMHGLFASGDGVLAGISNSAGQLELRDADPKQGLKLGHGELLLFRDTFLAEHSGRSFDLIGVVGGALDAARRAGFFGVCAAVESGDSDAYRLAYETVVETYRSASAHHLQNHAFENRRDMAIAPRPTDGGWRNETYRAVEEAAPPLLIHADWGRREELERVFEAFELTVNTGRAGARSVIVTEHRRPGSIPLTNQLLDALEAEARQAQELLLRKAREEEERKAALAAAEKQRQDRLRAERALTQENFERLLNRVSALEAHLQGLERSAKPAPARQASARAAPPRPKRSPEASLKDQFGIPLWRLGLLALLLLGALLIIVSVVWFFVLNDPAADEAPQTPPPARSSVLDRSGDTEAADEGETRVAPAAAPPQ